MRFYDGRTGDITRPLPGDVFDLEYPVGKFLFEARVDPIAPSFCVSVGVHQPTLAMRPHTIFVIY